MHADESALLRAVCDNPDDDAPRLIYADWLDDTGNVARVARAEFIRLQIGLARAPLSDRTVAAREQRAWQLLNMRIQLAAGLDPFEEVLQLRRMGETWATIGRAAGMTRQSAHERWGQRVLSVLDRYGSGELGGPVADDDVP